MHMHTVDSSRRTSYSAPVMGADWNPAAHGGVAVRELCACGAQRHVNVNGVHAEYGPWIEPDPVSSLTVAEQLGIDVPAILVSADSGMRGILQPMPAIADPSDLRAIMARHGLSRTVTANLLDVPQVTVDGWLAPPESTAHRAMPANLLRLLALELREAKPQGKPAPLRRGPKPRPSVSGVLPGVPASDPTRPRRARARRSAVPDDAAG